MLGSWVRAPRGSRNKANSLMEKWLKDRFFRIYTSAYRPAATFTARIGIPFHSFLSPAIRILRLRQNKSPKDGLRQPLRNLTVTVVRHSATIGYELRHILLPFSSLHSKTQSKHWQSFGYEVPIFRRTNPASGKSRINL